MRLSPGARVLLAMTGVLAISVFVLVAAAYAVTTRALMTEVDEALRRETDAYTAAIRSAPDDEDLVQATRAYFSGRGAGGAGRDVVLVARTSGGRTIANSEVRIEDAAGAEGLATLTSARFATVTVRGERFRLLATPIVSPQGERLATLEAGLALGPVEETARRVALTLGAAGLLALALGVPISYFAARRSLGPLTRMARDARAVSHAAPGHRIAYDGPADELGSLAESLNAMLDRLEIAYDEQRRFIADASHELRTPLAVVRGNVELLRSGAIRDADAADSLAMIEAESVRMSRLLEELLALARFDAAGEPVLQPLNARALLDETAARARTLADREFLVAGDCDLWLWGDPDLLERLFSNLVRNAIAHTEVGGRIEFACAAAGDVVEIAVSDDGPGLPSADLSRVFDRFYRAPRTRSETAFEGAGLGLAIVKRIVELHGGSVRAENVTPNGARFVVSLPMAEPD